MSAGAALAAFVVIILIGLGVFYADQSGFMESFVDELSDGIDKYGPDEVFVTPQIGSFSQDDEDDEPDTGITVTAEGRTVRYPTLFDTPRWNHVPITYYMDVESGEDLAGFDEQDLEYVRSATKTWEEKTDGIIRFEEVDNLKDAELVFEWFPSLTEVEGGRVVGEGGPTRAIETGGEFTLIEAGQVFLLPTENRCVGINRPVHEIGHVLGLGHAPEGFSDIMFSREIDCRQNITDVTINAVKKLYAKPPKADLVISSVDVLKKGDRLDINVTVRNIGIEESVRTTLGFFDGERSIESLEAPRFSTIPRVPPGDGITNRITGVKVPADMTEIILVADNGMDIDEYDEENNRVVVQMA